MRLSLALAIVIGIATGPTLARAEEDPLVATIDQLTAQGDCMRALTLLEYARATPASIAGRRGICFANLGLVSDAEARAVDALRSPDDAWVVAHRDLLLGMIRRTPTVATPPSQQTTETGTRLTTPPTSAHVASAPADPCPPGVTPPAPSTLAAPSAPVDPVVDEGPVPDPHVTTERSVAIDSEPCVRVARRRTVDVVEANPYYVDDEIGSGTARSYDISCVGRAAITVLPNPYR